MSVNKSNIEIFNFNEFFFIFQARATTTTKAIAKAQRKRIKMSAITFRKDDPLSSTP